MGINIVWERNRIKRADRSGERRNKKLRNIRPLFYNKFVLKTNLVLSFLNGFGRIPQIGHYAAHADMLRVFQYVGSSKLYSFANSLFEVALIFSNKGNWLYVLIVALAQSFYFFRGKNMLKPLLYITNARHINILCTSAPLYVLIHIRCT